MGLYFGLDEAEAVDWFASNFGPYRYPSEVDPEIMAELTSARILVAYYGPDDYSGEAWILYERAGVLYEVHGLHCSCMGFEDQWSPEETSIEAILRRATWVGYLTPEVRKALAELVAP